MEDLISIIVPVYNVEDYLDRCVRTLVGQTYRNCEIILVNDGSLDNSGSLCRAWEAKDGRIRVIHKSNGGLADARNAGLDVARGDYIGFVDSDDWVDVNMYEVLIRESQRLDCDIVESDIHWLCGPGITDDSGFRQGVTRTDVFSISRAMELLIEEKIIRQTVWNKVYRKHVLTGMPFEKGRLHEDEFWTYRVFGRANRIGYVDARFYYYFQRPGSIMGNSFSLRRLDALEGKYRRWRFFEDNYPNAAEAARKNFYFSCLLHYEWSLDYLGEDDFAGARKIILNYVDEIIKEHRTFSLNGRELFWYALSRLTFHGAAKLKNIFRKG